MADGAADYDWTVYRWEGRRLCLISVATLRTLSDGDFLRERVWRLDGSCRWKQTCPLACITLKQPYSMSVKRRYRPR